MAIKLSTKGGGGGIKPPTSINAVVVDSGGIVRTNIVAMTGCSQTAAVSSATLTEVLNISGSGVLTFAAMHTDANTLPSSSKFRIVLDGTTILDSTDTITDQNDIQCATGFLRIGNDLFVESDLIFTSSLVISIAGDGTNANRLSYKRYLT